MSVSTARGPGVRGLASRRAARKRTNALPIVLMLVGCGGARVYEPVLVPPPGWSGDEPTLAEDPDVAAEQVAEQLDAYGLQQSFWPVEPAEVPELQGRGLIASDGPCGPVVSAWIRSVPLEHPLIASERAVELDEDGTTIEAWPLPVHSVVAAVDRDRILVPLRFDSGASDRVPALAITPEGEVEATTIVPELEQAEPFACPSLEMFGDSDYLRCLIFVDRSTREPRRIAYETPCT